MDAVFIERVSVGRRKGRLGGTKEKCIRKAPGVHAMKRRQSFRPLLRDRHTVTSRDLITRSARIVGAHFKPRGKDNAIHLIAYAVEDNPCLGNLIQATTIGVHQRHIRTVEGRQVFIMKTRSLTKLAVVGLERFSCFFITR